MEILEKNLLQLEKTNKNLADKIRNIKEIKGLYELKQNLKGEYNLSINGKFVHSITGAQSEAEKVFKELKKDSPNSLHIVYGMGLGYMPDYYIENTKGYVIVYEPDIETLRIVFEIVDFETQLNAANLFFASDIEELKEGFSRFFKYKTETDISCLDYYKYNRKNEFETFCNECKKITQIYSFNYRFHVTSAYKFLVSTMHCMIGRLQLPELRDYKNIFSNVPAVIVSAGPSLAKNIDALKSVQDRAVIFCVGAAYKTLYENGITPDFCVLIERIDTSHHYTFPNNKDVNIIIEPFTNYKVFMTKFKRYLTSVSYETSSNHWFEQLKNKTPDNFEAKGTVSYQALYSAKFMGCNPLILLGQDLAYVDGKCYAKGSQYEDLVCIKDEQTGKYKVWPQNYEKFKNGYCSPVIALGYTDEQCYEIVKKNMDKITNGLAFVDSQDGGKLPTQSGYALFIEYFKDFANKNNGENILINSSTGGANIPGFKNIPLSEAMQLYKKPKPNIDKVLDTITPDITELKTILNNIEKDKKQLEAADKILTQGQSLIKTINNEHKKHKKATEKSLNATKKAVSLYFELLNNYFWKNTLFRLISTEENGELGWFLKENKDVSLPEKQKEVISLLDTYFTNVHNKVTRTLEKLNIYLEKYNESSTSKG